MKFSNIFHLLLAGVATAGLASCMESVDYTPAEPVALSPYYFSTGNGDYESLEEGQTSFSIIMGRASSEGTLTVPLQHNPEIDGIFNVPAEVTFAEGEGVTTFDVTFDMVNIEKKKEYNIKLSLADVPDTPYSLGTLNITAYYNPWETLGMGIYTDAIVPSIFDIGSDPLTYNVEIQTHADRPGVYRLRNPYKPGIYPITGLDYGDKDYFVYINAADPEGVYVETSNTGFCGNPDYGRILVSSEAYENIQNGGTIEEQKEADLCGELVKGNITIPKGKFMMAMEYYQGGAFSLPGKYDMKLTLPGYKPETEWKEVGMCNYTDGFAGPFMATPVLNNTYPVLVEQHKKNHNLYRIVDPFGAESGYTASAEGVDKYIVFDVTNPKCIQVGEGILTPYKDRRFGVLYATTVADWEILRNNLAIEEIIDAGYGGSFENGVITIPGDQVVGYYKLRPNDQVSPKTPVDVVLDLNSATPVPEPEAFRAPKTFTLRK